MEKDNQDDLSPEEKKSASRSTGPGLLVPLVIVAIVGGLWMLWAASPPTTRIEYSFFLEQLKAKNVAEVRLYTESAFGRFKVPPDLPRDEPSADSAKPKTGDKPATTAPPVRAKEHFTVQLPTYLKDNTELSEALAASGARYDNAPPCRT